MWFNVINQRREGGGNCDIIDLQWKTAREKIGKSSGSKK
jgi:hypothetical protein